VDEAVVAPAANVGPAVALETIDHRAGVRLDLGQLSVPLAQIMLLFLRLQAKRLTHYFAHLHAGESVPSAFYERETDPSEC
jgi:hypothetical protein